MGYGEINVDEETKKLLVPCPICKENPVCDDVAHDCARQPDLIFRCWTDNCPLYFWPESGGGYGIHSVVRAAEIWNQAVQELRAAINASMGNEEGGLKGI